MNVAIPAKGHVNPIPSIRGAIVTEVTLVDQIERCERGAFQGQSLPGHLIHICTAGEVEQRAGGVTQHFGVGDAIWYYENAPVQGSVLQPPWVFYTVSFRAPSLPPPPLNQRVFPAGIHTVEHMSRLLKVWRAVDTRECRNLAAITMPTSVVRHRRIDGPVPIIVDVTCLTRRR